ncbi:MAG: protein translocase subunit SecF [Colwellia sp.]|uniref:protein translocase subunit SecF n=1 Tax=Colwellia sp. TaxID=56799 RepID=UPI001D2DE0C7|nr:protein translocase subunit SecF [Colwellia sp.]MCJ8297219.1 protein translocase subunit SecF [Colwellia sp.]NQY49261.1 protein translocase subunit SecF [Colwellia sp.]
MNNFTLKLTKNLSKLRIISAYFAVIMVLISLLGLFNHGLNLGLDFTGGYLTEFSTQQSITQHKMSGLLTSYLPDSFQLSSADNGTHWSVQQADNDLSLKGKAWLSEFSQQSGLTITPQDSIYIGSQVGEELINQGGLALLTAVMVILLYLSLRFEWRLAAGSVIALFHDVIIVLGLFAWFDISFDLTILASLLAIIGYSLNDSIIIGDKVREIMKRTNDKNIDSIINQAIKSTIARTLITSGTTLTTILAIWIFAGESLSGFAIALFLGVLVGTFSSIAISATVPQLLGLTADYYHKKEQEVCQLP